MTPENSAELLPSNLPTVSPELVQKARESLERSVQEIGRPALERFEAQKGKDVKVNEGDTNKIPESSQVIGTRRFGDREITIVDTSGVRESMEKRWKTRILLFIQRVQAMRGIRGNKGERILSQEETEKIRRSVERGVERVYRPFEKRVERHQRIRDKGVRYRATA